MSASTGPSVGLKGLPEQRPASRRGEVGGDVDAKIKALHVAFRDALLAVGDYQWLAAAIGEGDSYHHDIAKGVRRDAGREIQLRWLVPLLEDPRSAEALLKHLCEVAGFEPPVRERTYTPEEYNAATADVIDGDEDLGAVRQIVRERTAKKLGVRVEDLP